MIKHAYLLILFFISTATFAQEDRIVHDKTVSDTIVHQQQKDAQRFGLSLKEWQLYENVMQSSLGWEMQKSHPIAVLGRAAKTEEDRQRYAIMLVQHEKKVADGLLAFAREIGRAHV